MENLRKIEQKWKKILFGQKSGKNGKEVQFWEYLGKTIKNGK